MTDELSNRFLIGELEEFADGQPRRVDIGEHPIAVARLGDEVLAVGDTCSHADFSLSDGEIDADECTIECPRHGAQFSLTTGEPETLPATVAVPVYGVEVVAGEVWVTLP